MDTTTTRTMEQWEIEALYGRHDIFGPNPYKQERAVDGAPSIMAARVWMAGLFYWNQPISARLQRPLQPNDLTAYFAPPVPHSGAVNEPMHSLKRHTTQSDIPYVQLKAPRF